MATSSLWSSISVKIFQYSSVSDKTTRTSGIAEHLCDRWILPKMTEMP